jgi:nucleoid DNA-binding protein
MGRRKVAQPVRSSQLAVEVAKSAGIDPRDARVFIEHLTASIIHHLSEGRTVHLDSFGTFRPVEMKGVTRDRDLTSWTGEKNRVAVERAVRVFFKKAHLLKEALR